MKTILLTIDYELFGDGSGNVFKHMIEPTNRILSVCNKYNTKITVFFEVVEYWALKREWEKGNTMGYLSDPIKAIEKQLQSIYKQGHDIQLHIHPQWVDSQFIRGRWEVDLSQWRLGWYYIEEGEKSLYNLLKKGKETIESIIHPIDPSYTCIALRAGGYNVQPSEEIIRSMHKLGLLFDTSVYTGGVENNYLSRYDYSSVTNDKGYWFVEDDMATDCDHRTRCMEVPIVALPVRTMNLLFAQQIRRILIDRKSGQHYRRTSEEKFRKLKFLFEKEWQIWDFCMLSSFQQKRYIKSCNAIHKSMGRNLFVAVSHPYNLFNTKPLVTMLESAKKYDFNTSLSFSELRNCFEFYA